MRQARIGDWLLEMDSLTRQIRVISPRTGPGFETLSPEERTHLGRLLYALAKELLDAHGVERS